MLRREFKKLIFGVFVALVFVFLLSTFYFLLSGYAHAQNGSLYLSPSSGNISVGQTFSLVLRVNTGGVAINAAEGSIVFDQQKLSVTSVSKSGSVFSIWAEEPKFSNAEGNIEFAGGVPNPGYSGSNGVVITINFKAKTATTVRGYTEIVMVSGAILANDGQGTNILSSLGKATYFIGAAAAEPIPVLETPVIPIGGQAMTITSSTHPDQSKWYSNKNPMFKWDLPSGVSEVILVLSKRANSPPIIKYSPPISEKALTDLEDGVWYLNGRFRTSAGLGTVASFKFNIDTQPPRDFSVVRFDTDDSTNPRPELLFESSDATSGIDKYEMKIGDGDWFKINPSEAGKAYKLPLQRSGTREVLVKAIDKAGNSTDSNTKVIIKPVSIPPPLIKEIILPKTKIDKVAIIKEEVELVVKELVVKELVVKELVVKGMVAVKVAAVIVDVLKLENSSSFGQISESVKNAEKKLIKTVEASVNENGNFEAKIYDLDAGTYIVRAYGKDERGAISDAYSDVVLKIAGESVLAQFAKWVLNAILRGFDGIVNILSGGGLFIAFIIAIVGLALALVELFKVKSKKWFKPIMDWIAVRRAQKGSNKQIEHIIKDIEKEMKFLHSMSKIRRLGPEENYLKTKMEQYLKTLKNLKNLKE